MAVWMKFKFKSIFRAWWFAFTVSSFSTVFFFFSVQLAADVFSVEGVLVDVTADTAAAAKVRAIKKGERNAFYRLISKLTVQKNIDPIPSLSADEITNFIHDFSVSDEKTSDIRYIAELNFWFKAEAVRQLFNDYDVLFAETTSKPVLVIPILKLGGAIILWDDPNLWRQAWSNFKGDPSLVPIKVPLGDLKDVSLIGAEQALNNDFQRLEAIANRYGTGSVAIAIATSKTPKLDKNAKISIQIFWNRLTGIQKLSTLTVGGKTNNSVEQTLLKAVELAKRKIENHWKRENLVGLDKKAIVNVTVPINGLKDWLLIHKQLKRVHIVRNIELVFLSLQEIRLRLHFLGETGKLTMALAQEDLSLVLDQEEWLIIPSESDIGN